MEGPPRVRQRRRDSVDPSPPHAPRHGFASGWSLGAILGLSGLGILLVAEPAAAAPLAGANANFDQVCLRDDVAGLHDVTASVNSDVANDFSLGLASVGGNDVPTDASIVYLGMKSKFEKLFVNVGTAGQGGTVEWSYSKAGTTWGAITVSDPSSHFTLSGTRTVTFTAPSNWAPVTVDSTTCGGDYYYLKVNTLQKYSTSPKGTQASAAAYNLRIAVLDELGTAQTDLAESAFTVTNGTTNTVFGFRNLGGGSYEFAIDAVGADRDFTIKAARANYVNSTNRATGTLNTQLQDLTTSPLGLKFPIKVVVRDSQGQNVTGATVKLANAAPAAAPANTNLNYFHAGGALSVSKSGFEAFDPNTDTKGKDVKPGTTQQTLVTLTGTPACTGANEVPAGASATCRGLRAVSGPSSSPTGGSTPPTSNSQSPSSSTPASGGPSGNPSSSASGTPSAGAVTEILVTGSGNSYSAEVASVAANTRLRLRFPGPGADGGLDVLELLLASGGQNVRVEVERSPEPKPEWGLAAAPGPAFGYVAVRVYVGEVLVPASVQAIDIEFRVPSETLGAAGAAPERVRFSQWVNGDWSNLPTRPLGERGADHAFASSAPGTGHFAILSEAAEPGGSGFPWGFALLGALVLLFGAGGAFAIRPRRRKPVDEESTQDEPGGLF